jgi:hypothetical protein
MASRKPAAPKPPCHIEQSFGIVSRAVHDVTKRLETAELRVAELDAIVIGLGREVARLKQPWWRRWL